MKHKYIILFLLVFSLSFVLGEYDVSVSCYDNLCVEGFPVNFTVTIITADWENKEYINFTQIEIKDKQYNTLIAREETNMVLTPILQKNSIVFRGILPAPTSGDNLYYIPCFEGEYGYSNELVELYLGEKYATVIPFDMCGSDTLTLKMIPKSEIQCSYYNDSQCLNDELCDKIYCKSLNCSGNQYADNHICQDLKCNLWQKPHNNKCSIAIEKFAGVIVFAIIGLIYLVWYLFQKVRQKRSRHKK